MTFRRDYQKELDTIHLKPRSLWGRVRRMPRYISGLRTIGVSWPVIVGLSWSVLKGLPKGQR